MLVVVNELVLKVGYDDRLLFKAAAGRLRVKPQRLTLHKILRRSLDARNLRKNPCYVVNAVFDVDTEIRLSALKKVEPYAGDCAAVIDAGVEQSARNLSARPVVVGAGPAGLLAALVLARAGAKPLLLERGKPVEERRRDVGLFWGQGILDPQSNVLFGEGGAGTFSDGKLTSRSKDRRMKDFVLQEFVHAGAAQEILYEAFAHIGSDRLAQIIPQMRKTIIELGGEVRFNSAVDRLVIEQDALRAVCVDGEEIECSGCVLACGHSADDVFQMLSQAGVALSAREYAVGVRVELPQAMVDRAMLGDFAENPLLGAASYRLTSGGDCHTFCMCPGGRVIACSASEGKVGTNGMSLSTRSGKFSNAAFLVPLPVLEDTALAGMGELAAIEEKAFAAAGGDYALAACTLPDLLGKGTGRLPDDLSCHRARFCDFSDFLPEKVLTVLREQIPLMLRRLPYVDPRQAVLYGPETRSTSAVRIERGSDQQSTSTRNLYPAGEGAGYAGGIVSSAIDGAKAALALLNDAGV